MNLKNDGAFTADTGNCYNPKTEHIVSFLDHS